MKKFTILLVPIIFVLTTITSCSSGSEENEMTPSYVGQYFYYRNVAKVNGTVTTDENHENNSCSSKSNYTIKSDNSVISETYSSSNFGGPCNSVYTANYTYDTTSQTIDGQKVSFEANNLILSQINTFGTTTTENIFYYKRK